jgi:hypothetical protein
MTRRGSRFGSRAALPALALALLLPLAVPAYGQEAADDGSSTPAAPVGSDSLRVFLLTFDPGTAVWERFGHNALWIHDPGAGTDTAYHWGLFDMSEEGFLTEFLKGRMVYSMGDADAPRLVEAYRRVGRDVTVQELALTEEQAAALQRFVQWNLRPENRQYRYDYFRDNCSTRVRDALDDALGGVLRGSLADTPAEYTWRSQAVALTAEDALLTTGMDLGLGPLADRPITRWDLAFIPMRLREDVRDIRVRRGGASVPLVVGERDLPAYSGGDAAAPPAPAMRALAHLLAGLLLGGLFVAAGRLAARPAGAGTARAWGRWALGLSGTAWALVVGVLGSILLALWTLTDHVFAWRNENLLQASPIALALVVLVPLAVVGRAGRWATRVAGLLVGLSLFGLFLHPLPVTPQANLPIIALALPAHLGLFYALWRLARSEAPGAERDPALH